ncbi:hypothetical protein L9F63_018534, partial [Diploptera punctata]
PLGKPSSLSEYILSESELFNLAVIGSLPGRGISQVRIHWLLDLISVSCVDEKGEPHYNFTLLDRLLDWLHTFRLNPGFELMGNPSQFYSNFSNKTQVQQWSHLVEQIAARYIERYGMETVETWRFETWNEPDLKGYNILNFTLPSYLRYFTASVEGLKKAGNGRLRIGGPAGTFGDRKKHALCWGLVEHCANMIHCPLDFISFHKKGGGHVNAILQQDIELALNTKKDYPTLTTIPFANDESDPLKNWSLNETWRGDVRYGAMVASVIVAHQDVMVKRYGLPVSLLSNDNAFLNYHPFYFNQRTLLARFQMNRTEPPHVQFFKKPVYTTMALLSLLGNQEMAVTIKHPDNRLSVVAAEDWTRGTRSIAVLVVFSNDTVSDLEDILSIKLQLRNISDVTARYVVYLLDNNATNPQQVWLNAGSPVFPELQQRFQMRSAEGPYRARGPAEVPRSGDVELLLPVSLPSVVLVHLCSRAAETPGQVSGVLVCNVTYNEVMIFWSDQHVLTRCIKTYEIEFCAQSSKTFRRINLEDTIFLSYQYVVTSDLEEVKGRYRVRAVDYWSRPGPYSSPIVYPGKFSCPKFLNK